ncbi:MAG: lyase family protein [bacterium]|nr:lyase family protein [bacterium]MDZ4285002.1 lyase family protein [Patescibacteria group bacterium]
MRDVFDSLSPADYRYWDKEVAKYLSENGFTRYKLLVERALVRALARRGLCSTEVVQEVETACGQVTTEEVYEEEDRIRHDIRALVNRILVKVSKSAKPYVHMTATSCDIIDSANAARYKDVVEQVLVPSLTKLEGVLIDISLREAETVQVGRTHGQHAVPITFGFALAEYVSRLGGSIEALKALAANLPGKFSGAVGAYNASSLFFDDPEGFEAEVLAELGLVPAEHSTQIVPPEALTRLFCEITIAAGILANLSDDMRHLQRTEIGEVGEEFEAAQVGSSTMPQKRNPINFENAKSLWKVVLPRIITVFLDQISEHQRDLTNSASGRTYGEIIAYVVSMAKRLTRTMSKLKVDRGNLLKNLEMTKGAIVAEPLQLILAAQGHPDAHEKVRTLTLQAEREKRPLEEVVVGDVEVKDYLKKMTPYQRQILSSPSLYTGIAAKKARAVAERWKQKLEL